MLAPCLYSGRGTTRNHACVITASAPRCPAKLVRLGPAPLAGSLRDSTAPRVIARIDSTMSSMWSVGCVLPTGAVAIQPPTVENSNDCEEPRGQSAALLELLFDHRPRGTGLTPTPPGMPASTSSTRPCG